MVINPTSETRTTDGWLASLQHRALRPVGATSLAVVRIAFGAIGLVSAARLVSRGWIGSLFADPVEHLRYPGLAWIPVPPAWAIHGLVVVVALASLAVLLGWRTRAAAATFVVAFAWLESIEATAYLNHYWFLTITGALFVVLPMSAAWSLDARRVGPRPVPAGAVWLVRAQIGLVYVFAGVAKLNGDWLVHGLPLGLWLPSRAHLPLVGPLLELHGTALLASWAGAAFDCLVVGFLLWRRTRAAAWAVVVAFHLVTWWLFPVIGVFPWLMIAASTVFFDPDWPERLRDRWRAPVGGATAAAPSHGSWWRTHPRVTAAAVVLWALVQVGLPLRHLAYPGDHRWSGEGLRHGWNVMLVEKAGVVRFELTDPASGRSWTTDASEHYTTAQLRVATSDPELIRQMAHALADRAVAAGDPRPQVRADALVSLNGRPAARLVDPTVDLAREPWRLGPQPWILPAPTSAPPG